MSDFLTIIHIWEEGDPFHDGDDLMLFSCQELATGWLVKNGFVPGTSEEDTRDDGFNWFYSTLDRRARVEPLPVINELSD